MALSKSYVGTGYLVFREGDTFFKQIACFSFLAKTYNILKPVSSRHLTFATNPLQILLLKNNIFSCKLKF